MTYRQLLTDISLAALLAAPTLTLARPTADQAAVAAAPAMPASASAAPRGLAFRG